MIFSTTRDNNSYLETTIIYILVANIIYKEVRKFHARLLRDGRFERLTRLTCNNNVNDVCVSIRIYDRSFIAFLEGGETLELLNGLNVLELYAAFESFMM